MSKSDREYNKQVCSPISKLLRHSGSMTFSRNSFKNNGSQTATATGCFSKTMGSTTFSQCSRSSMFSTTTHALMCSYSGHQSSPVTYVCLLDSCDKESRVACSKCIRGNHSEHAQQMVKISELINHSNTELVSEEVGLQNFPLNPQGQSIRAYLQKENGSVSTLYRDIENFFEDFNMKISEKLQSLKKEMLMEVNTFYLRGNGRSHMGFLAQLKKLYAEAYDPTEISNLLRAFLLREISSDTLHTTLNQILKGSATRAAENKLFTFYSSNPTARTMPSENESKNLSSSHPGLVEVDMSLLNSIQEQVIHSIDRIKSSLSILSPTAQAILDPLPTMGVCNGQNVSWQKQYEDVLNFLNSNTKSLHMEKEPLIYKKESYADRSTYLGFHYNGNRHLLGARYYADGNIYFGQWDKGAKQGLGVMHFRKGTVFQGQWLDDKRHGTSCIETYANGSRYEGPFVNGFKHGFGKFIDSNGKIYEGQYVNDQRSGVGRFIYKNGTTEQAYYVSGEKLTEEGYEKFLQQGGYSTMSQMKNRQIDESSRSNQSTPVSAQQHS